MHLIPLHAHLEVAMDDVVVVHELDCRQHLPEVSAREKEEEEEEEEEEKEKEKKMVMIASGFHDNFFLKLP
jgi:hypothetical protein